ncbi:hypothetical protein [Nitrosophilus alvini]|uniref:hypothetical protein n=1 Tax=Nitrosophilus alvini TaxID=2714855 RepID=UPI00190C5A6C|nr:hypothetical protein [Nitrosophilus alvini]
MCIKTKEEVNKEKIAEIKQLCMSPESGSFYIKLFSLAIRQKDPVAKFILLYLILLSITAKGDERQIYVDKYIKSKQPDVKFFQYNKRRETIYTKLRNEIAHKRETKDPTEIIKNIESVLAKFQSIVQTSILENIN